MSVHPPPKMPRFYTPKEVGQMLQVSPATIRNMIKRGDLDAIQLKGGRGIFRVPETALQSLMGNDLPQTESRSVFKNI